jgi:hypothetical protein
MLAFALYIQGAPRWPLLSLAEVPDPAKVCVFIRSYNLCISSSTSWHCIERETSGGFRPGRWEGLKLVFFGPGYVLSYAVYASAEVSHDMLKVAKQKPHWGLRHVGNGSDVACVLEASNIFAERREIILLQEIIVLCRRGDDIECDCVMPCIQFVADCRRQVTSGLGMSASKPAMERLGVGGGSGLLQPCL